jgi:putative intracellular protease/amidase
MKAVRKVLVGLMIFLCFLVAGQAFGAESKGQVLLILHPLGTGTGATDVVDYMIIREFGMMKTTLSDAGFTVIVATVDGKLVQGKTISIMPDLKLSDVHVADYKGIIVPCMNAGLIPDESVQVVKDALAQGKPIAAQNGAVRVLSLADGLKGKNFAISAYFATGDGKQWFNWDGGKYVGDGVVQDGKIVTSGVCPTMAKYVKTPDGTLELTQKLIALMQ